jgi:hypothetical protein
MRKVFVLMLGVLKIDQNEGAVSERAEVKRRKVRRKESRELVSNNSCCDDKNVSVLGRS